MPAGSKAKKARVANDTTTDRLHERRLSRYYLNPPYGNRFWILSPFVSETDYELQEKMYEDFGQMDAVRPMHKEDIF